MAYNRITWVPDVLRAAGLTVVEHDGWRERGLSTASRFEPRAVVWHHDASAVGDSPGVPASMIARYSTAAAQLWVDRYGRWHIIASGRAPHAGVVLPGKPDNYDSIGVETDHTTGEAWPPALLDSLRRGTAAILDHLNVKPASGLEFHKSICSPPGRKIDPAGLDLGDERGRVAALIAKGVRADTRPAVSLARVQKASRRVGWARVFSGARTKADVKRVKAALKAERVATYRDWQKKIGLRGADADGIPGRSSLTRLGDAHGFRVAP